MSRNILLPFDASTWVLLLASLAAVTLSGVLVAASGDSDSRPGNLTALAFQPLGIMFAEFHEPAGSLQGPVLGRGGSSIWIRQAWIWATFLTVSAYQGNLYVIGVPDCL